MLWLLGLLLECALLSYLDHKIWKTWFTPLHFVMVPYLAVLLFTLCLAGRFGLSPFYYPSLLPWILGLPLFTLPGVCFYGIFRKTRPQYFTPVSLSASPRKLPLWLVIAACTVYLLLAVNLIVNLCHTPASCGFGSDCFAERLGRYRFFSHLSVVTAALAVVFIGYGKNYKSLLLLLPALFFLVTGQVKSWVILPLLAGFLYLLLSGEVRLKPLYTAGIALAGVAFFFLSYMLVGMPFSSIASLCVHYITSGTMGLSLDMQQGVIETHNLDYVFAPFINLFNFSTGRELVSAYNPAFLHTGINYTNIRTLFGTLFVFMPVWLFVLVSVAGGAVAYALLVLSRIRPRTGIQIYAWCCTLLFMGWFDLYIQTWSAWEIPLWLLLFSWITARAGKGEAWA